MINNHSLILYYIVEWCAAKFTPSLVRHDVAHIVLFSMHMPSDTAEIPVLSSIKSLTAATNNSKANEAR